MDGSNSQAKGIITRTTIGIKGKAKVGEAGIEKTQTAEANEAEFEEMDITELPHCQCGALIKTIEEVGGVDCVTNDYLCLSCANIKCSRCLKSVGVESMVNLFGNIYCKKCARRQAFIALAVCLTCLAVLTSVILW